MDYFQALLKEIKMYKNKNVIIDTIFIGGGTPSFMFDGCISTLLSEIRKNFNVLSTAEITIESNPNSITLQKAREWKDSGINRVSVGLQTSNHNSLMLIGRTHTKNDYIKAIEIIKSVGFTNINTDCLIGLPRQKLSDVKHTLNLVTKLGCSHVSVYSLILEEGTPLYDMVEKKEVKLPKEIKALGMYHFAYKFLKSQGFDRYEVSNFAKPGTECKHNLNTWEMGEYLGFGAGDHGYLDNVRYSNCCSIEEYVNSLNNTKKPVEYSEELSDQEKLEETIMLGLRTKYGINLDKIKKEYNVDLFETEKDAIEEFIAKNLLYIDGNNLIATDIGFTVLNKIILDLVS